MKNLTKFAVLGAVLAASASVAFATTIPFSGSVGVAGGGSYSYSAGVGTATVTNMGNGFQVGSGTLADFDMENVGGSGTVTFNSFSTNAISGVTILTITATNSTLAGLGAAGGTDMLTFVATGDTDGPGGMANGSIDIFGTLSDSDGLFTSTPNNAEVYYDENTGDLNFTEDAINIVPEPDSLILLGSGLLGAAGMLYRRRISA